VYRALRNNPHIYTRHSNKLHTLSRNHTKLHICQKKEYPYYLNNQITLSTHPKRQQTQYQPKQQTSQKQKKALTATTITTVYPGKKSAEEERKEHAPEPKSAKNGKQ
jgi:hypothetical protein